MVALMEAGVLEVLGSKPVLKLGEDAWIVKSNKIPGEKVEVRIIVDAYVPPPNLIHTDDRLLRYILEHGHFRPHKIDGVETGAIDITRSPYYVIDKQGVAHARRFAVGVLTEGVHWATTSGARPCVSAVRLTDNDVVARAAVRRSLLRGVRG